MKLFYQIFVLQLLVLCAISCSTESVSSSADVIPESEQNIANQETARTPPGDNITEAFSFIQLCDTQLGQVNYLEDIQNFKKVVNEINKTTADFVIVCGDLIHNGNQSRYQEFNAIKSSFKMPCYVAAGNHDIGINGDLTKLDFYRENIGQDYYSFERNGMAFLVTNTQFWKTDWEEQSHTQDEWLKTTLTDFNTNNYPSIVIGHYPLFLDRSLEPENAGNLPLTKRTEILNLFKENNVKAYLSGHTHKFYENDYEGIMTVSGESMTYNYDGSPLGYRLWEVSKDSLTHTFIPVQ